MAPSPPFMVMHPNRSYLPQSAGKRKGAVSKAALPTAVSYSGNGKLHQEIHHQVPHYSADITRA
jgi:hypothetical protein